MRNLLKKIKMLFILLFAVFYSCEKDLYDDAFQKEESNYKYKSIKLKDVKNYNENTANEVLKFQNLSENTRTSEIYGKVIDSTNVIYLVKEDGFESFTFKILQTEGLNYFENIIINNYPNGNIEVIIAKFNLSKPLELVRLDNNFTNSLLNIEASKLNSNNNLANRDCITVGYYETVDACEGELVTPGENPECFNADGSKKTREIFIVLAEDCSNSGGGSSGGVVVGPPSGNGDGSGGSGGEYSTIFIPNPYEGEEDPSNPSFVLAGQIASFISTIKNSSYQMQLLFNNTSWLHAALIDFGNDNDDFTQEDKDAITFTLNNIVPVFNTIYQNSTDLTGNEVDVLKYNALMFLLNNPNSVSVVFINDLLNEFFANPQPVYDQTNYPGKNLNYPFEWWKNDEFIKSNILVTFEVPNAFEILAFNMFPAFSLLHIENSTTALDAAVGLTVSNPTIFPPTGIEDGKADAFRHAFWNALDTAEFGPNVTKLFTTAHEAFSTGLPKTMDLHNNQKGRQNSIDNGFGFFTSNSMIKDSVLGDLYLGNLVYIKNILLTPTNQ